MTRLVFVWLPDWPIERLRRQALRATGRDAGRDDWPEAREREPFALVGLVEGGLTLHAVNGPARHAGLRAGQMLADARAALPGLLTAPADPAADHSALVGLARWAGRYGPARNVLGEDGFWIDITGAAHLFGGETALASDLAERLMGFGLTAHVALAETLGAACALARYGTGAAKIEGVVPEARKRACPSSTPPGPRPWTHDLVFARVSRHHRRIAIATTGAVAEALAPLPIEGLRLEPAAVQLLKRLGLRRIGALQTLPRTALEERFRLSAAARRKRTGEARVALAGAVLTRLDQALGRSVEVLNPLVEPPLYGARLLFPDPLISNAGIEHAVASLSATLAGRLAEAGLGARRFTLACYRCDGTVGTVGLATRLPTDDGVHIARLLIERVQNFDAGFGVDCLSLEARRTERIAERQGTLADGSRSGSGPGLRQGPDQLIDRLVNRLGPDHVIRLAPVASHIPERAERRLGALGEGTSDSHHDPPGGSAWPLPPGPRPVLLLPRPEPVEVMAEVPDGAPLRFTWRRRMYRVVKADGPERIAPEWWRHLPARGIAGTEGDDGSSPRSDGSRPEMRDYYRIEDDRGGRFWVFRSGLYGTESAGPPLWFVHGLFA